MLENHQKPDNIAEFTVWEFFRSMKNLVEDNFGYIRIKGEISGFKKASSGHLYFNLKDEKALINAVCFRQMASIINFDLSDGLEVVASGRVSIYEGRSNYQIVVEKLEMAGIGAILKAIEQTRVRLLTAGYFDQKHKKPLPFLPQIIAVITSPTGAVIEDIINRVKDRFPSKIVVYPALMQGKGCSLEVINGINHFNQLKPSKKPDLIIIARGGGSFEDLLPFNDENLVMAVFNSAIPIISAVGHETDTTLIDFVADIRAATPTAAAEMAVPVLKDLQVTIINYTKRLNNYFLNSIDFKKTTLVNLSTRLLHPTAKIANLEQRISNFINIINNNFQYNLKVKDQKFTNLSVLSGNNLQHALKIKESHFKNLSERIYQKNNRYENWQNTINYLTKNLQNNCQNCLKNYQDKSNYLSQLISSYNYKNVLARGYAVLRHKGKIFSSSKNIAKNQLIEVEVIDGKFNAITAEGSIKKLNKKSKEISEKYDLF